MNLYKFVVNNDEYPNLSQNNESESLNVNDKL